MTLEVPAAMADATLNVVRYERGAPFHLGVARENLPVTTVVFANRSYAILKLELAALGGNPGPRAQEALDIAPPAIDFVALSNSLGVPACRVESAAEFAKALRHGFASKAPNLIEIPLFR